MVICRQKKGRRELGPTYKPWGWNSTYMGTISGIGIDSFKTY